MKTAVFAGVALIVMAVALPLAAEEPPEGPRARDAVARFLELTAEQVTAWDALLERREAAVRPLREELRQIEEDLRDLLASEAPDAQAIGTLVLRGKELREDIGEVNRAYVEAFEAGLREPQRVKLGFVRRADRVQPLLPAFRAFGLLGPPAPEQRPR